MNRFKAMVKKTLIYEIHAKDEAEARVLAEFAANGDLTQTQRDRVKAVEKHVEVTEVKPLTATVKIQKAGAV